MSQFYSKVVKGFTSVTLGLLDKEIEYDLTLWLEDLFVNDFSFFNTQSILIGSIFAFMGIYWVLTLPAAALTSMILFTLFKWVL